MVYGPWTIDKKSPLQAKFYQRPTPKDQTANDQKLLRTINFDIGIPLGFIYFRSLSEACK
jgi:hypothetical protein